MVPNIESSTKNTTEDEIEMDLTSAAEDLNTHAEEGLLSPNCNAVHTTTVQELKDSSSALK